MSNYFDRVVRRVVRRGVLAVAVVVLATVCGMGLVTPTTAYADTGSSTSRVHKHNLLRAHSLTDHGYAKVSTYDNWEGDGDFELSDCGMVRSDLAPGVVNRRFRMYAGAHTTGQQLVLQFVDRDAAIAYVNDYRAAVDGCSDRTDGLVTFGRTRHPKIDGATSARWWTTHSDEGWTRSWGTVSIVRSGDRVGVLTMYSTDTKPYRTMDVPALMQDMVNRLVLD